MVFNLQEMDLATIRSKTEIPRRRPSGQDTKEVSEGEHCRNLKSQDGSPASQALTGFCSWPASEHTVQAHSQQVCGNKQSLKMVKL